MRLEIMDDIRSVLSKFKVSNSKGGPHQKGVDPSISSIPDIFFDEVLLQYKLSRSEILVLMYLYRQVWSKPNLNSKFGIGPLHSFDRMAQELKLKNDELVSIIHALERHQLIQTVRVGQYFVRKFFTEEFDMKYGQSYDEFF